MNTIYLAGGCFWGMQKYFDQFDGVVNTVVGYANGHTANPTYEEVKSQKSGHAETLKIDYNETKISLTDLLEALFVVIDPTSLNKQGEDEGISYRTGIYYTDLNEYPIIQDFIANKQKDYDQPIVVEVKAMHNFYLAEEYHQKYLEKNPDGYCHIDRCFFHLNDK